MDGLQLPARTSYQCAMLNGGTIERLNEKLAILRRRDKKLALFGSGPPFGHGYKTHRVSQEQIASREAEFGFRFPNDYRQWLTSVGWGAGPYYGLFAPDKVHSRLFLEDERGIGGEVDTATEMTPEHIAAIQGKWRSSGTNSALGVSINSDQGFLVVSEVGCGGYAGIVLHGPLEGKIFILSPEITEPRTALCALAPEGAFTWLSNQRGRDDLIVNAAATFSFFDWYEDWLDRGILGS